MIVQRPQTKKGRQFRRPLLFVERVLCLIIKLALLYEQNQPLLPIERALNYFQIKHRSSLMEFANSRQSIAP
jgi:hypothetical protein